ncbi:hypothetical protein C8Q79DRAFT_1117699 [Trametes meyenii]|nr:hypothetical protein C8Q79DRAFT_1117699 [Trametes meyenii]
MPVENHPLQKTFHPTKTDELRNKAGRCKTCDRARKPHERFQVCTGCKVALYCGEDCQRADWPSHKALCKYNKEIASLVAERAETADAYARAAGIPTALEMKSLLRDYTEAHRPSFHGAFQAKLFLLGGAEKILPSQPQVCLVPLHYQPPGPEEGPNPALTFTTGGIAFLPRARVLADASVHRPRFVEAWDASAAARERMHALYARDAGFVDLLPVMFSPREGPTQMGYFPMYRSAGTDVHPNPTAEGVAAELELQMKFIELGVVVRNHRWKRGGEEGPVPGYMLDLGSKWVWKPLVDDWDADKEWHSANTVSERVKLLKQRLAAARRSAT